jgi:hypothetical protein
MSAFELSKKLLFSPHAVSTPLDHVSGLGRSIDGVVETGDELAIGEEILAGEATVELSSAGFARDTVIKQQNCSSSCVAWAMRSRLSASTAEASIACSSNIDAAGEQSDRGVTGVG